MDQNQPEAINDIWSEAFVNTEDKSINIVNLRAGVRLIQMDLHLKTDVTIHKEVEESPLEFGCLFSGSVKGECRNCFSMEDAYECHSGQTWVSFYPQSENSIEYLAGQPIRTIFIQIEQPVFKEYLGFANEPLADVLQKHLAGNEVFYNRIHAATPIVLSLVNQIRACPYDGMTRVLFMESKILELMAFLLDSTREDRNGNGLSRADEERVRYAKDILLANMESPLSLKELAQRAGICATKLSSGFRILYQNTVFGLLRDERLEKARMLMKTQEKRACEAAWEVGYSSLSSFHRAFSRKFGVNPGYYSKTTTGH